MRLWKEVGMKEKSDEKKKKKEKREAKGKVRKQKHGERQVNDHEK